MTTPTLSEFLLARYAEDEAAAEAVPPPFMHRDSFSVRFDSVESVHSKADSAFVDRFTPARVLADIEVKRRIVERCKPIDRPRGHVVPDSARAAWDVIDTLNRATLRDLAAPYADHPDYNPAWKLEAYNEADDVQAAQLAAIVRRWQRTEVSDAEAMAGVAQVVKQRGEA